MTVSTTEEKKFVESFEKFLKRNGIKIFELNGFFYFQNGKDGEKEIFFKVNEMIDIITGEEPL